MSAIAVKCALLETQPHWWGVSRKRSNLRQNLSVRVNLLYCDLSLAYFSRTVRLTAITDKPCRRFGRNLREIETISVNILQNRFENQEKFLCFLQKTFFLYYQKSSPQLSPCEKSDWCVKSVGKYNFFNGVIGFGSPYILIILNFFMKQCLPNIKLILVLEKEALMKMTSTAR